MSEPNQNDLEKTAKEQAEVGFFREFWGFLRDNNKWSLLPILIVLVLLACRSSSAALGWRRSSTRCPEIHR